MKRLIVVPLLFGIAILYFACSDNNPTAPNLSQNDQVTGSLDRNPAEAAGLFGEMDLYMGANGWDGTVTFEGNGTYGIRFFHLSDKMTGVAYHFGERWEIYDPQNPTIILMAGPDEGVSPGPKYPLFTDYVMNGYVSEASGEFEEWIGHRVHMSGVITYDTGTGAPLTAPGIFRLN